MMKRICVLRKFFNDGGRTIVEFVEIHKNKFREVKRETLFDGSTNLSIYNDLTGDQIQRDIALYKDQGYQEF